MVPTQTGKQIVTIIDDLSLPSRDITGAQSALEVLRDYFTSGGWHLQKTSVHRPVLQHSFFATMNRNNLSVSPRLLHQFACFGLDELSVQRMQSIFKTVTSLLVQKWGAEVQAQSGWLCDKLLDVYKAVGNHKLFKGGPSPSRPHFSLGWTDLLKVCAGLSLVEPSYLKDKRNLHRALYHESMRVFCDKIQDKSSQEYVSTLIRTVIAAHHKSGSDGTQQEYLGEGPLPRELYFSFYNPEVEGFYVEIDQIESATEVIDRALAKYNDSPDRPPLGLIMIKEVNRTLMKIVRALSTYHGCLLTVAVKGSGISHLVKLSCFNENLSLSYL